MRKFIALACIAFGLFGCDPQPAFSQGVTKLCAEGISGAGNFSCATTIQPQATGTGIEASHTFKATAANVVDFQVINDPTSAVLVMLIDGATVPTDGTVLTGCVNATTPRPCIAKWWQLAVSTTLSVTWSPGPFLALQAGMILVCSTPATTFFTKTGSAHCLFSGEAM